eukprot:gene14821-18073_t
MPIKARYAHPPRLEIAGEAAGVVADAAAPAGADGEGVVEEAWWEAETPLAVMG